MRKLIFQSVSPKFLTTRWRSDELPRGVHLVVVDWLIHHEGEIICAILSAHGGPFVAVLEV